MEVLIFLIPPILFATLATCLIYGLKKIQKKEATKKILVRTFALSFVITLIGIGYVVKLVGETRGRNVCMNDPRHGFCWNESKITCEQGVSDENGVCLKP